MSNDKKVYLMIDDAKPIAYLRSWFGDNIPYQDIHLERDATKAIELLKSQPWDVLFLDHDLAAWDENKKEITGMSILNFLEDSPKFLPKDIVVITGNPVAMTHMIYKVDELYKKQLKLDKGDSDETKQTSNT